MDINKFEWDADEHLNRDYNWDRTIAETRIITIAGNAHSELQAAKALETCRRVGQPNVEIFTAYDGTDRKTIRTPNHLKNNDVMTWVKVLDPALSITEVACALSHLALWSRCITINRPIVILEHDAIMIRPFLEITQTNSIEILGHYLQVQDFINYLKLDSYLDLVNYYLHSSNFPPVEHDIPMTAVINYNFLYCMGLHSYAIDPFMARRLFSKVLTEGLINPIDVVVEVTEFELAQTGLYAFNSAQSASTTIGIKDRKDPMRGRKNTHSIPGVSQ
jgi:GR25 family glycosyltransferase involved in LPS biosynthesis